VSIAALTNVKKRIVARENSAMALGAKIYLEISKYFCSIMSVSPHGCAVAGTIMPPSPPPLSSSDSLIRYNKKFATMNPTTNARKLLVSIYHTPGMICPVVA
jgi:dihydroorotase